MRCRVCDEYVDSRRDCGECETCLSLLQEAKAEGAAEALAGLSCDECGTADRKTRLILCGKCCRVSDEESRVRGAAEEREALAKWFEESDEAERVIADMYSDVMSPSACGVVCLSYADAIRARGEKKP